MSASGPPAKPIRDLLRAPGCTVTSVGLLQYDAGSFKLLEQTEGFPPLDNFRASDLDKLYSDARNAREVIVGPPGSYSGGYSGAYSSYGGGGGATSAARYTYYTCLPGDVHNLVKPPEGYQPSKSGMMVKSNSAPYSRKMVILFYDGGDANVSLALQVRDCVP